MPRTRNTSEKTLRVATKASRKTAAKRSTARNVAKSARGWSGDDLDEVMKIVAGTRAKSRF